MITDTNPDFEVCEKGNSIWVAPIEELSMSSANFLSKNIYDSVDKKPLPIVLDLSKVNFINSAAIGVIVNILKVYKKKKLGIYFLKPNKFVYDVLEQTNLTKIIKIYHDEEELPKSIKEVK